MNEDAKASLKDIIDTLVEMMSPEQRKATANTGVAVMEKSITGINDSIAAAYRDLSRAQPDYLLTTLKGMVEKGYMANAPLEEKKGLEMSMQILATAVELLALMEPLKAAVTKYNEDLEVYKSKLETQKQPDSVREMLKAANEAVGQVKH